MKRLQRRLLEERFYDSRLEGACLRYQFERCDKARIEVVVRERHEGSCGGDPAVEPVVDRFRVDKRSRRIEWYDVKADEFVGLTQLPRQRKR